MKSPADPAADSLVILNRAARPVRRRPAKRLERNSRECFPKNMLAKIRAIVFAAICLGVFTGCATKHESTYSSVLEGMSRNVLRYNFGEPLRIAPGAAGGEDWYYRFSALQIQPTGSSATSKDFGQQTTYVSVGLELSRPVVELPVHVSAEGFVVPPLPKGKVIKN